jgi:hypothetical protein
MDEAGGWPHDATPRSRLDAGSGPPPSPPPPPRAGTYRARFDGAFVGPMLPPGAPPLVDVRPQGLPPVSEAVLAIPLGTRELVRQALDLLTRRDAGLRGASFYIGFILLVTVAPLAVILGLTFTTMPGLMGVEPYNPYAETSAWPAWMLLAAIPAFLGYLAAATEARSMATAVIGGRVEGRPLHLRSSIAVARRRFWSMLGAQFLIGVIATIASFASQGLVLVVFGNGDALTFVVSLIVSLVVSAPFVYVPAGIILGEVGVFEAIARSMRLVWLRKRLAVVVTLFGVLSQFIVLFGLSEGIDIVGRIVVGTGLVEDFPPVLVVPIAAAMVFALGTLTFIVEAIAAAPAVHAFEALTHYTHGLEVGRREPVRGRRLWDPWLTPGLALTALLGLLTLVGAVLTLPA